MESLEKDYLSLGQLYDGRDHTNPEKPTLFPRRQFVRMSAGTIGGLLASGLWLPATALAHSSPLITLNRGDLVGVKVRNTGTGSMEVHILTAASNYQQFSLHTGTPINEVDASDNFVFFCVN
jgi:hypothetical protein